MKKRIRVLGVCTLTIIALCVTVIPFSNVSNVGVAYADGPSSVAAPTKIKAVRASDTALKISWKKVEGAQGYSIYRCNPKAKAFKKVKTVEKSKSSWTNKKLKSNKVYKYKVRSFTKVNGKKVYSPDSYIVSATPNTKNSKKANAKNVYVAYTNRYLGLNRAIKAIDVKATAAKGKTAINKKLVWTSSDTSIVTVNQKGWLQAKGKAGTAKVYVRAHNGIVKTLKVTVGDYANPVTFSNLDKVKGVNSNIANLLTKYKDNMCRVATYFENRKNQITFSYEDNDIAFEGLSFDYSPVEADLLALVKDAKMRVILYSGYLFFSIPTGNDSEYEIAYFDYNGPDYPKAKMYKLAPCWYFYGNTASY